MVKQKPHKKKKAIALNQLVICRCPVCKSENIADNSMRENNGIYGSGFSSWKINETRVCNECGIMFVPVKGNGI